MSYRQQRSETMGGPAAGHDLRCRWCGKETEYAVLAELGARCRTCYEAFCATLPPAPPKPPASAVPEDAPKGIAWAYRLRWRHRHGDPLSRLQIEAYQSVLARAGHLQEAAA